MSLQLVRFPSAQDAHILRPMSGPQEVILLGGRDAIIKWLENNPNVQFSAGDVVAPKGLDLSAMKLGRCAFAKIVLEDANFTGATLDGCNFDRCRFTGATTFKGASAKGVQMRGCTFEAGVELLPNISDSNLAQAKFNAGARLPAEVINTNLQGAVLVNADLRKCRFHVVNLDSADLTGADLRGSAFRDCQFTDAKLPRAQISGLTSLHRPVVLAIGCPERVRDFSESVWVDQLGRARLQYIAEDIRRWALQIVSAGFLLAGGSGALFLLAKRVIAAVQYLT